MQNEIFAQNISIENISEINILINIPNQNKQGEYIHVDG